MGQMAPAQQPPPEGLRKGGRRLWTAVTAVYVLTEHEQALLKQACRTVYTLDGLDLVVAAEGLLVDGRPHAAVVEARQQRIVLARMLAALRLPDETGQQPQRRGVRGVYHLRSVP
jgi:hypothetical protein